MTFHVNIDKAGYITLDRGHELTGDQLMKGLGGPFLILKTKAWCMDVFEVKALSGRLRDQNPRIGASEAAGAYTLAATACKNNIFNVDVIKGKLTLSCKYWQSF